MPIPFISPVSNSQDSLIRLLTADNVDTAEVHAANHLNDLAYLIVAVICSILTVGAAGIGYRLALSVRGLDKKESELKGLKEALQGAIAAAALEVSDGSDDESQDELRVESHWNGQKTMFYFRPSTEDPTALTVALPQLNLTFTTHKISFDTLKQKFGHCNHDNNARVITNNATFSAPPTPTRTRTSMGQTQVTQTQSHSPSYSYQPIPFYSTDEEGFPQGGYFIPR